MPNAAGLAINELLNTYIDVTATPQHLPGMVGVNNGPLGTQFICPSGPNQGKAWNPGHAYMVLETGSIRVKCDGTTPDVGMGTLYVAAAAGAPPTVIDWSSTLNDYQGMLHNFQAVVQSGTTARLSISFQN